MKKKNKKPIFSEEYDYLKASSVQDCTGLIPSAIQDDAEIENYQELYPFLPKVYVRENTESESE